MISLPERVRCSQGASVTVHPYCGFFLVHARDLNDALDVAAGIPSARLGCVEVRPIDDLGKTKLGLRG